MSRQSTINQIGRLPKKALEKAKALAQSQPFYKIGHAAGAFVMAAASMGGMSPFALAFAASRRGYAGPAAIGAFAGYSLFYGASGLTYAAAVLICFACTMVFKDFKEAKNKYFMPVCAALCLLCTKSVIAVSQGLTAAGLLLCEAVICGGFCFLFQNVKSEGGQSKWLNIWSRLSMLAALILAAYPLSIDGVMHPARAAACFVVICCACFGGSAFGAGVGVAFGACMDLAGGAGPFFCASYGFAGLICGLCREKSRFISAICYVMANGVAALWGFSHPWALQSLYECFAASVAFVALPEGIAERIRGIVGGHSGTVYRPAGQRAQAAGRIFAVSQAVGALGEALGGIWEKPGPSGDNIGRIFDAAAESVCKKCSAVQYCWSRDYVTTFDAFNQVSGILHSKNYVEPGDFPQYFSGKCVKIDEFYAAVNQEYRAFLRKKASQKKNDELKSLMSSQYQGLQAVLEDMADSSSCSAEYYPGLEGRVKSMARAYWPSAKVAVYSLGGRMHVEITSGQPMEPEDAFLKSLASALEKRFLPPKQIALKNGQTMLRYSEKERFSASVSCTVRKKHGEDMCGDTNMSLHTDDGRAIVLLSDGMGTGKSAGMTSQRALALISSFVKSGCSLCESTKAVMPVLTARFEEWGFVTLDLLEINLFSGKAQMLKYGAAPSFLIRDGRIARLCSETLPAGLEPVLEQQSNPAVFKLHDGDKLIMFSDGVWENAAAQNIVEKAGQKSDSALGTELITSAVKNGAVDDMTVLIVNIFKSGE